MKPKPIQSNKRYRISSHVVLRSCIPSGRFLSVADRPPGPQVVVLLSELKLDPSKPTDCQENFVP